MKLGLFIIAVFCLAAVLTAPESMPKPALGQAALLRYEVDTSWPRLPLPNSWVIGGVGGTCVDTRDHVLLLNRQNVPAAELAGGRLAPPIIEFDSDGTVAHAWGDPTILVKRLHDCHFDQDNNVWIIGVDSGFIQKYSHDGSRLLLQVGEPGQVDSSDGTPQGKPLNSSRARFFTPSSIDTDSNGDFYIGDGHSPGGNFRAAVFSRTWTFLRQWRLLRTEAENSVAQSPHCVRLSHDGLVYVCDRWGSRIQVFDRQGHFKRNIDILSKTPTSAAAQDGANTEGGVVALDFSRDPEQRFIYIINSDYGRIDILDRQSGRVLSSFAEGLGRETGQLTGAHGIAVDSKGNVYVAEQQGRRLQRFKPIK